MFNGLIGNGSIERGEIEILFAEGNPVNVQVIHQQLESINYHSRAKVCCNGEELVSVYKAIVNKALENRLSDKIKPVKLIFTEQKFPRLRGTEAINEILEFIKEKNQVSTVKILEPRFVFLTAYRTVELQTHLSQKYKIQDCYEKPLTKEQLREIIAGSFD